MFTGGPDAGRNELVTQDAYTECEGLPVNRGTIGTTDGEASCELRV